MTYTVIQVIRRKNGEIKCKTIIFRKSVYAFIGVFDSSQELPYKNRLVLTDIIERGSEEPEFVFTYEIFP